VSDPKTHVPALQGLLLISQNHAAARLLPEIPVYVPTETTEDVNLQVKRRDGSDGTRTRDLRRDRPSRAQRRLATSSSERLVCRHFPP
jgi:hypothetical protein